jgi:hypothetical protein
MDLIDKLFKKKCINQTVVDGEVKYVEGRRFSKLHIIGFGFIFNFSCFCWCW